jgi:hypothetical protein
LALEEKKVANKEHQCLVEEERKLFFMDTSHMDERQKEYIKLARDEVLAKKRMLTTNMMNAPSAGYGGYGGMIKARFVTERFFDKFNKLTITCSDA